MRLKDLAVVVTGSGRGIGRAIALRCGEEGARLVVNDTNPESLEEVYQSLLSRGMRALLFMADVSKRSESEALVEVAVAAFGRIDVLVNNAGIMKNGFFVELSEEDWDDVLRVNLKGIFNCAHCGSSHDAAEKWPHHQHVVASLSWGCAYGKLCSFKSRCSWTNTIYGNRTRPLRDNSQCCGTRDHRNGNVQLDASSVS